MPGGRRGWGSIAGGEIVPSVGQGKSAGGEVPGGSRAVGKSRYMVVVGYPSGNWDRMRLGGSTRSEMDAGVGLVRLRERVKTERNRKIGEDESTWEGRFMQLGLLDVKRGCGRGTEPPNPSSIPLVGVLPTLL